MTDGFWERGPLRRALYHKAGRALLDGAEKLRLHGARVSIKTAAAIGIPLFVLFVFYPLEHKGWTLWLQDEQFAAHVAMGVVAGALLIGMLTSYAREAGRRDLVIWGNVLAIAAFVVSLASGWNYLLHEQQVARAKSAQAQAVVITAPTGQLEAFDAETAAMLSTLRQALADAPANAPTGKSYLTAQITAYIQQRSTERVALVASLDAAQAKSAAAAPLAVDPRPLDAVIASALPGDRDFWGVLLDLLRALFIKSVVFFGLPLALTIAPEAKREQDKRAAASERAKAQPREAGKWRPKKQPPRLVQITPDDDPDRDPPTPLPYAPDQEWPVDDYHAGAAAALINEVRRFLMPRLEDLSDGKAA